VGTPQRSKAQKRRLVLSALRATFYKLPVVGKSFGFVPASYRNGRSTIARGHRRPPTITPLRAYVIDGINANRSICYAYMRFVPIRVEPQLLPSARKI
jgi:hypothetical protein